MEANPPAVTGTGIAPSPGAAHKGKRENEERGFLNQAVRSMGKRGILNGERGRSEGTVEQRF
jgi:hypothetical protein